MRFDMHLPAGLRVGLLGGSFDPPHAGHVHISREALKRFDLDRVIWLVSPGNPLKPHAPAPLSRRLAAARQLIRDPRILASDFEARVGTRYTAQTLQALQLRFPGVGFVWLMGADNLAQLHRWDNWHDIMHSVPVGVMARPGLRIAARASTASRIYRQAQMSPRASRLLPSMRAPAWCFVNLPMMKVSSSDLRAKGGWSLP